MIYEYKCECGKKFEYDKYSIKDDSKTAPCPACKKVAKKIPSLSSFHLKGSGWFNSGGY